MQYLDNSMGPYFDVLSNELILNILPFIDDSSILKLNIANKFFYSITSDEAFWKQREISNLGTDAKQYEKLTADYKNKKCAYFRRKKDLFVQQNSKIIAVTEKSGLVSGNPNKRKYIN